MTSLNPVTNDGRKKRGRYPDRQETPVVDPDFSFPGQKINPGSSPHIGNKIAISYKDKIPIGSTETDHSPELSNVSNELRFW